MKKQYRTPRAVKVDFTFDEHVTATSSGAIATYGDPQQIGRCQQSSPTACMVFWTAEYGTMCKTDPLSLSL